MGTPSEKQPAVMTEKQFDAALQAIEMEAARLKDDGALRAVAYRDQHMAQLFKKSGWKQEMIAFRMKRSQQWVSARLTFQAFLDWLTTGRGKAEFPLETLTEWRFRRVWGNTRGTAKTQEDRFRLCLPALTAALAPESVPRSFRNMCQKPGIRKAVIALLSDGQKRGAAQVAAALDSQFPGLTIKQISACLQGMQSSPPKGHRLEAIHHGRKHHYRLVKTTSGASSKAGSPSSLMAVEVRSLCREIQAELRKTIASMSTGYIMEKVALIEKAIARLVSGEVA